MGQSSNQEIMRKPEKFDTYIKMFRVVNELYIDGFLDCYDIDYHEVCECRKYLELLQKLDYVEVKS